MNNIVFLSRLAEIKKIERQWANAVENFKTEKTTENRRELTVLEKKYAEYKVWCSN